MPVVDRKGLEVSGIRSIDSLILTFVSTTERILAPVLAVLNHLESAEITLTLSVIDFDAL